ncbi:MAG: hypothetical protein IJX88_04955 [Clostridia bacterium]|nr:hypothetical protein [Clostridia bacterium]
MSLTCSKTLEKLQQAFCQDLTAYQSIPFWSWNNDLDEQELVKQIEEMKQANIGGFIMHARLGLSMEYLGEKWFSCVEACLKKAKELKMNAWVYDENGWPSGFVGGKLLENEAFRAQFLELTIKDTFDSAAYAVYEKTESGYRLLDGEKAGLTEYHTVYIRTSPANTDILNPDVVDAFIQETHEKYYERFKDSFGKELVGFFTDEPQYYRWAPAYTRVAESAYVQKYGKNDIKENIIYIFNSDKAGYAFKYRWFTLLNELYVENYYKKLYDWCEAHNCKLTGHSIEETSLSAQMWGGAGVMPSYEYEHIPAVDKLGNSCCGELMPKQVGSVASQLGYKQILTETFACSGTDVTPWELKNSAESQYFNGVNLMCQHLFPYSFAGQAKYDHPPVFSKHGNWWEQFAAFNEYFTKLGYIVANTQDNYDILILHPLRSVYVDYIRENSYGSVAELENSFAALLTALRKKGVQYHFADERILARHGKAEGDKLRIGKCVYNTVLVPEMKTIARETLELLHGYTGKLCVLKTPEYIDGEKADVCLTSNTTLDEIVDSAKVYFRCESGAAGMSSRCGELGDFLFIKNYTQDTDASVQMQGIAENYRVLDLENLCLKAIENEFIVPAQDGVILVRSDEKAVKETLTGEQDITNSFKTVKIGENSLVLDYGRLSLDGKNFGENIPLPRLFENLLRADYKGMVYIRQTFEVVGVMPMRLMLEKGRFEHIKVNGVVVQPYVSDFDFNFVECDLTGLVQVGTNTVEYAVNYYQHEGVHFALFDPLATESVRNCLYYDTHIENAYIHGDFVLDENLAICARKDLPPVTSELRKEGYPFFKGTFVLEGEYEYDGVDSRKIFVEGKFLVAELYINGKRTDCVFAPEKNITQYLQRGKNTLRIVLRSSLRNLIGPHHYAPNPEPTSVGPNTFTMRGQWGEGEPASYTHKYQCVRFGADRVVMKTVLAKL